MNDVTFFNIAKLADQPLRFAYAISFSHGKDGNRLLAKVGEIFEREYLIRQKKLVIIGDTEGQKIPFDFRDFDREELEEAFCVFAALAETFKAKHKPSSRIFQRIAALCIAVQEAQAGIGLA